MNDSMARRLEVVGQERFAKWVIGRVHWATGHFRVYGDNPEYLIQGCEDWT